MALDVIGTRLWLLGRGPAPPPPLTTDGVGIFVDTNGALLQQLASGVTMPIGFSRAGLIDGGTSEASLAAAIAQANAIGGQTIVLGKGTYNLTAQQVLSADGISIIGNGPGSTFLQIDDAGGMAGADAFLLNSVLWTAFQGLTFTSTAARTAGSAIKVLGRNNITAQPAQRTRQYTIEDVDMQDQFNGVTFNDGPASAGAWGGFINRGEWIRFSAGGVGIWVNSPHGGQHYLANLKLYNGSTIIDANRAKAAIRYQGGADLEMFNINEVYFQSGLVIDPPNGQPANVTKATECEWDSNTRASILIAPQAGGTVLDVNATGWVKTEAASSIPAVQIDGGSGIRIHDMDAQGCFQAVRVAGPAKNVKVYDVDGGGSSSVAFYATGSATDFSFTNNVAGIVAGLTPAAGFQADAGCDHYSVTGNNFRECTTPITNTPGTSAGRRIVQDNIIA